MTAIATAFPQFFPEQTTTLLCGPATGSARLILGTVGDTIMIKNEGPSTAFLAFGTDTVVATAGGAVNAANDGSYPILAGEITTVRVDVGAYGTTSGTGVNVAGITAATGSAVVRITRGSGV